jgi:hypothetical protein
VTSQRLPDELRRRVESDLEPVRPLPPSWRRALVVAAVAVAVFAAMVTFFRLRPDLHQLPMWLSWGCALVQLGVGVLLAGLALRESVPGAGVSGGVVIGALGLGLAVQMLVGFATWMWAGQPPAGELGVGVKCMRSDLALAVPIFIVALWLVFRALPLRAPVAGALGGTGAALASDAASHMRCPMSDLQHLLVWHTGAVLVMAAAGWLIGWVWGRLRWRRLRE